MDQPGEKEEQREEAAAAAEGSTEEYVGEREGCNKAEESAAGVLKEVAVGSDEASPPLLAHPCSLLQFLLRACAGCLGLHGGHCGSSDGPKPAAVPAPPETAAEAAADSSREGDGGGKANYFYMQEVVTRVWAVKVRRPTPPDHPREGNGGNGGVHH